MSYDLIVILRKKVKQYGMWAGVRYMRNQGIAFEYAYFVMFNRFPVR